MTHRFRFLLVLLGWTATSLEAGAQDWAARFPPAPECSVVVPPRVNADVDSLPAGMATLAIRVVRFGRNAGIGHAAMILTSLDSSSLRPRTLQGADSSSIQVVEDLPAGRYQLRVRRIGYNARTDTVVVRSRSADTITVALREFYTEYRNLWNCRPRRFRYPGESACVDDREETDFAVEYTRRLARPDHLKLFPQIPPFDSSDVAPVRDEQVCERAALAYGEPGDPPRRVIVVRMGQLFMVIDPHEPLTAGEWDIWRVFNRRWESVLNLTG